MVDAICSEAKLRSNYLHEELVETIYFGGGTPSILSETQIDQILSALNDQFIISEDAEITFEANPENLSLEYLSVLKNAGVNRLSVGLQSFDEGVLIEMNRAHTSEESLNCIKLAIDQNFKDISIDLIYGLPYKDINYWREQVKIAVGLGANHISAYCLTIESNTVFSKMQNSGELELPSDEESLEQFHHLVKALKDSGFEQYEISNFAKEGGISKHNSAYWLGKNYIGLGPSAHSYDGGSRSWNVRNNPNYIKQINLGSLPSEKELLSNEDRFNDYILTRLRTKWGLSKKDIQELSKNISYPAFNSIVKEHVNLGNLLEDAANIYLTESGKFVADGIASDLFV